MGSVAVSLVLVLGGGCAAPVSGLYPPLSGQPAKTVYVVHRGLHTGLIVRTADIPPGIWPEHKDFPEAQYLEVGWGDTEGYRFPLSTPIVVRALFHSRGSVLLLHAFTAPVSTEYAGIAKEIIAVGLSERGLERLCVFIQNSYHLDPFGRPIPFQGHTSGQEFYQSNGRYWLFNNCNHWTARALRAAGCPIRPGVSISPGCVMLQARRFGERAWPRPVVRPVLSLPNKEVTPTGFTPFDKQETGD